MNETEKFLKELDGESQPNILDVPLNPQEEIQQEDVGQIKEKDNREARRAKKALQDEREANIKLAAKIDALTEVARGRETPESVEYLKSIEKIYGTDTPEALAATELLKNALTSVENRATERAFERLEESRRKEAEETEHELGNLDRMVEEIEDEYGIDLPDNSETTKGFFRLLTKLSPKDSDGSVINYADHFAVWEEYQNRIKKGTDNRAKDLSSRSMVNSRATESKIQDDSVTKYLKENDLI